MTRSGPPALAVRLMNEAMTDPAVIGDLVEEHARGRSAWWFWKQAMVASAPSPLNALRWAIAIPLAYGFARLVGSSINSTGWEAGGRLLAGSLSAASLILIAAWIVPSRKLLVAKTLLAIAATLCAVVIAYSTYRSFGGGPVGHMAGLLRDLAASTLLGAAGGYAAAACFCRPTSDRPTSDHGPSTMD